MMGSVHMKKIKAICLTVVGMATVFCAAIPASAATTYIRGDANGDGYVDINDVTAIQRHLAELEHLSSNRIKAADVTGEGLDISDATAIQMYLAEYENTYKIGETVIYDEYELPFIPVK